MASQKSASPGGAALKTNRSLPASEAPSSWTSSSVSAPSWIAVVGNHMPRHCGIATFTTDLCNAILGEYTRAQILVVAASDPGSHYKYPSRVRFELAESESSSYEDAADFLNSSNVAMVSLQHEYGIYGGPAGGFILRLMRRLKIPVVTTLHTVLRAPNANQRIVMEEIVALSARLIVMSKHSSQVLREVFHAPEEKIDLIPHGVPDLPFGDPGIYKRATGTTGKKVLLTLGLLSPNKGIERVIEALPRIVAEQPDVVYLIVGATHPHIRQREGDRYQIQLQAMAKELGVERSVAFHNRFVSPEEMAEFVGSADIYITPYPYGGSGPYTFGPARDFMDAPTQYASVALALSPVEKFHANIGYRLSSVNGSRFFNDPRDVNGSLVSTYQTPFVNLAYAMHKNLVWKGEYDYFGYGEGGPSGAQYCNPSSTLPTPAAAAPVVPCSTLPNTAMSGPAYGYTAPRNFHANNLTVGVHYEF